MGDITVAGEDKEEVAKAVEETLCHGVERFLRRESHHAPLGPTCNSAAQVAEHRGTASTRQDKAPHGRQVLVEAVDHRLNGLDVVFLKSIDWRLGIGLLGSQISPDVEELVLDHKEELVHIGVFALDGMHHLTDVGIEFVDSAVGLDTDIIFSNTLASNQRGGAFVACESVNFRFHKKGVKGVWIIE